MKLFVAVCLAMFSATALAMELAAGVPAYDALITIFSEQGQTAVFWICFVGYAWALLRQFIKPERLSWLPVWVIDLLEFAAMNKGYAKNDTLNDPKFVKRTVPK
ncbi:hypothetical protein [Vibrio parahaemolyticus]|uniref:hypothetical protein n=1 Tax=Vibrio parahaemolyticus TaxID=670 RepID=UPI0007DC308D|nr:hypothetical protein [Vibrio parahaemolyticus]OAR43276.1 hypothetical protein EM55_010070 [Vibrio parahaemolyticus]